MLPSPPVAVTPDGAGGRASGSGSGGDAAEGAAVTAADGPHPSAFLACSSSAKTFPLVSRPVRRPAVSRTPSQTRSRQRDPGPVR